MTREWVYNPYDSETWELAWRDEVTSRRRPADRASHPEPPRDMASLLGAAPRVDLRVSAADVRIDREGLEPVVVALDGSPTSFGSGDAPVEVVGLWRDDAVRLVWDFGEDRRVTETWRLAETRERIVVERMVELPGRRIRYVTFVQVYDRDREAGGRGGA